MLVTRSAAIDLKCHNRHRNAYDPCGKLLELVQANVYIAILIVIVLMGGIFSLSSLGDFAPQYEFPESERTVGLAHVAVPPGRIHWSLVAFLAEEF